MIDSSRVPAAETCVTPLQDAINYYSSLDNLVALMVDNIPFANLFQSYAQRALAPVAWVAPELDSAFDTYVDTFVTSPQVESRVATVIDVLPMSAIQHGYDFMAQMIAYVFWAWIAVLTLCAIIALGWSDPLDPYFTRVNLYLGGWARSLRIQYEASLKFVVLALLYWVLALMSFDDEKEDFISFFDSSLVSFCLLLVFYVIWQHSLHFWAFLSATRGSGRRVRLIGEQFTSDMLSVVALSVRFYILLFRINVYDMLDDCFDSYYIFIGDFAENTYTEEALVHLSEGAATLAENQSDLALTHDTSLDGGRDLYVNLAILYFKVLTWLVFLLELALRLTLAIYVCYLVLFEVHGTSRGYVEDKYLNSLRSQ